MNTGNTPDFINQFIFTKKEFQKPQHWKVLAVNEYSLYAHPDLELSQVNQSNNQLILIGYCYDYRNPSRTNQEIIENLTIQTTLENLLQQIQFLAGIYLIIWKTPDALIFIPDYCCLREAFIDCTDTNNVVVASSSNLINLVNPLRELKEGFYKNPKFKERGVWIGNKTSFENITRLKPNHALDVLTGTVKRFFPTEKIKEQSVEAVVNQTINVMPGILKAIFLRDKKVMLGLTAGLDSRFLLAASKDIHQHLTFFVNRIKGQRQDYSTATRIAERLKLQFYQLKFSAKEPELNTSHNIFSTLPYVTQESFNNLKNFTKDFGGFKTISGGASEISKNHFSSINSLNGSKLASLVKYPGDPYCISLYHEWLTTNEPLFKELEYGTLDMFYCEEIMGNRAAKSISEAHAMHLYIFPAFNCRFLSNTFLTTKTKYREEQHNILYYKIIEKQWKEVLKEPINPSFKKQVIRFMQKIGVYNLYRNKFTMGIFARKSN